MEVNVHFSGWWNVVLTYRFPPHIWMACGCGERTMRQRTGRRSSLWGRGLMTPTPCCISLQKPPPHVTRGTWVCHHDLLSRWCTCIHDIIKYLIDITLSVIGRKRETKHVFLTRSYFPDRVFPPVGGLYYDRCGNSFEAFHMTTNVKTAFPPLSCCIRFPVFIRYNKLHVL